MFIRFPRANPINVIPASSAIFNAAEVGADREIKIGICVLNQGVPDNLIHRIVPPNVFPTHQHFGILKQRGYMYATSLLEDSGQVLHLLDQLIQRVHRKPDL